MARRQWQRAALLLVALPPLVMAGCPFAALQAALGRSAHPEGPSRNGRSLLQMGLGTLPSRGKFNAAAVEALDVNAVKADLTKLMTDSQAFWPADKGHYGGLFIRLSWHCNGSYRQWDGRGGCDGARQRFEPELAWDDNTNLDKARRLLEPIKKKYGDALSWGDLIVLSGDVAIESMGGPKMGFCPGRIDDVDGSDSLALGPTPLQRLIAPCKAGDGNCEQPLGQTTMGLIYVNPEGVMGKPVPKDSVAQIRGTFAQMGMNDRETVALIGGGHAFGKVHGACPTGAGPGPKEDPKNPWPGTCGSGPDKGKGKNTFTSGFEGSWTTTPTRWSNEYFTNLLDYNWDKHKGPGGHWQWKPVSRKDGSTNDLPDIMMLTTDIALLEDPSYLALVKEFAADEGKLTKEFGDAWYKLMTRDMGPRTRCVGKWAPPAKPWQMPLPDPPKKVADPTAVAADIRALIASNPALRPRLSYLAYQCAKTYRRTDYAGGCNGARIRFAPQKDWPANAGLDEVLAALKPVKDRHGDGLSWADLIVLGGTVAVEDAGGEAVKDGLFSFCPGRTDAKDGKNTAQLAPRTYVNATVALKDNANVQGLTLEEAVALSALPRSEVQQKRIGYSGVWGPEAGALSNAYFKAVLSDGWAKGKAGNGFEEWKANGRDAWLRGSDKAIASDPQLRKIAEAYAADNAKFIEAFAAAWVKAMNADRFKGPAGNECD